MMKRQRWEYLTIEIYFEKHDDYSGQDYIVGASSEEAIDELNRRGAEGWESYAARGRFVWFKRPSK